MGLINCKECGNAISSKAVACPQCGMPLKRVLSNLGRTVRKIFIKVGALIGGVAGLLYVSGLMKGEAPSAAFLMTELGVRCFATTENYPIDQREQARSNCIRSGKAEFESRGISTVIGTPEAEIPTANTTNLPQASNADLDYRTREEKYTSRYGIVKLVQKLSAEPISGNDLIHQIGKSHAIYLGDKKIAENDSSYAIMHGIYPLNDQDVLIYSSGSCGSNCYEYVQVTSLGDKGFVKLIYHGEALSSTDRTSPAISIESGKLVIGLGFENGKHKQAIYDGKTSNITLNTVNANHPVPEESCKKLYQVLETCALQKKENSVCTGTENSFAVASHKFVMEQRPQSVQERFDPACDAACNFTSRSGYTNFQQTVCLKPH